MRLGASRRGGMTGIPSESDFHVDPSGAAAFEGPPETPHRAAGRKGIVLPEGRCETEVIGRPESTVHCSLHDVAELRLDFVEHRSAERVRRVRRLAGCYSTELPAEQLPTPPCCRVDSKRVLVLGARNASSALEHLGQSARGEELLRS